MRMTAGIAIRSSIAPIADRASPSFATSLTTGQAHRWLRFPMCPHVWRNMKNPPRPSFSRPAECLLGVRPRVELWDQSGRNLSCADPIAEAVAQLRAGLVVAVKGVGRISSGGRRHELHRNRPLAPTKATGREALCRVGSRFCKPPKNFCQLEDAGRSILQSIQRPIVLLPKKTPSLIPDAVAPFNRNLGIFLPYTPLHYLLLAEGEFTALVMTSGNLKRRADRHPTIVRRSVALHGLADSFLVHNRDICCAATIRWCASPEESRASCGARRGFVPVPVFLKDDPTATSALGAAVGGELKNTICLTKGTHAS